MASFARDRRAIVLSTATAFLVLSTALRFGMRRRHPPRAGPPAAVAPSPPAVEPSAGAGSARAEPDEALPEFDDL